MITRKIILISTITAALLAITILVLINIYFFREMPPVPTEPKEKPAAEEESQATYAIPSNTIPPCASIDDVISKSNEKQKKLNDRELEAERTRNANRTEAFARQKALEATLLHAESQGAGTSPPPKKEAPPLSAEEMKALEKKGIISY